MFRVVFSWPALLGLVLFLVMGCEQSAPDAPGKTQPEPPIVVPTKDPVKPDLVPATECLEDVVDRMLPYWHDAIVPDLRAGKQVIVAAHGNSLRALVKHLDGISDDDITGLNIPTGIPLLYELDEDLRPISSRYLGDAEAAKAAADAVAKQAG